MEMCASWQKDKTGLIAEFKFDLFGVCVTITVKLTINMLTD